MEERVEADDVVAEGPLELPSALEMLSEEEAALYAILTDHSGIDLMELMVLNEENPDGCWRAWDFQYPWWRSKEPRQIEQAGRALGQSQGIRGRSMSFPFRHAGQEMVITAPQAMHVDLIADPIEHAVTSTWLTSELLVKGRSGVTHRPLKILFQNGARIIGRIPQNSGVGIKGCLVAGTPVETIAGPTPIEEIEVGEKVRTHENRWRDVTELHHYTGTTYEVSIEGHAGVQCSIEHPLLVRIGDLVDAITDDEPEWMRADDVYDCVRAGETVWVAGAERFEGTVCQFDDERWWYARVSAIEVAPDAEVFDITVEDDHSYIGAGLVMHNTHPVCLEQDEGQDYPARGWNEIVSTFNRQLDGAEWRIHGVPRGIPDKFQDLITKAPGNGFALHRYTAVHRPTWTAEEREEQLNTFGGSENNPEFRRNVYGELGPAANRIFELNRFMRCVDSIEGSEYNTEEFFYRRISAEQVEDRAGTGERLEDASTDEHIAAIISMCQLPEAHHRYTVFWAGMDVGLTSDPSEILIAAEYAPDAKERRENEKPDVGIGVPMDGQTRLKLLVRISLDRIPEPLQVALIMHLVDFYRPRAFSLDKTGIGVGILQGLQQAAHTSRFMIVDDSDDEDLTEPQREAKQRRVEEARKTLTVIKGYNFGAKIVVEIDEELAATLPEGLTAQEIAEHAGIRRNVKDYSTDLLRRLVDTRRLLLPYDVDMISQWNGQTWVPSNSPVDAYGKRRSAYSEGVFHTLDAGRMLALGYFQAPIEAMLAAPANNEPALATWVL